MRRGFPFAAYPPSSRKVARRPRPLWKGLLLLTHPWIKAISNCIQMTFSQPVNQNNQSRKLCHETSRANCHILHVKGGFKRMIKKEGWIWRSIQRILLSWFWSWAVEMVILTCVGPKWNNFNLAPKSNVICDMKMSFPIFVLVFWIVAKFHFPPYVPFELHGIGQCTQISHTINDLRPRSHCYVYIWKRSKTSPFLPCAHIAPLWKRGFSKTLMKTFKFENGAFWKRSVFSVNTKNGDIWKRCTFLCW